MQLTNQSEKNNQEINQFNTFWGTVYNSVLETLSSVHIMSDKQFNKGPRLNPWGQLDYTYGNGVKRLNVHTIEKNSKPYQMSSVESNKLKW